MSDGPSGGGPLAPGSTIGIFGGGQLGRMLSLSAARLGLKTHIFDPSEEAPAFDVAASKTIAAYDDLDAVARFAGTVDVVTYEFENIPLATVEAAAKVAMVHPNTRALAIAQDRLFEKQFLETSEIAVARYADITSLGDLKIALAEIGTPAILKTRRLGYDGKGQVRIDDPGAAESAYDQIAHAPAILEGIVAFDFEASVIAARHHNGTIVHYDMAANVHQDQILHTSTIPAPITTEERAAAEQIAARILMELDYAGVLAVELFHISGAPADAAWRVNELAPRVHNSGHWTIDACLIDQFENHIRAIAGWPLGSPERHSDAVMTNLIGTDCDAWRDLAGSPGTAIHLYGKHDVRPGRKMGHITRLTARSDDCAD